MSRAALSADLAFGDLRLLTKFVVIALPVRIGSLYRPLRLCFTLNFYPCVGGKMLDPSRAIGHTD